MQRRVAHVKVLLGRWLISEIEGEGISLITDTVSLKSITFLLVRDAEFICVVALESHRLFISGQMLSRHPCISEYLLKMAEVLIDLEVRICLMRRYCKLWIFTSKAALPLSKPTRCSWTKCCLKKSVTVNRILVFIL